MSGFSILGADLQVAQHLATIAFPSFPVNQTSIVYAFVVPVGFGSIRVVKVSWTSTVVFNDADGTMLVSVIARDATEGADDTLVNAQSVEAGTANAVADFTLATEGTEKEFTLDEGDSVRVSAVNNSAAIDTNGPLAVTIWYHSIPKESAGDDIKHASNYR